MNDFVEEEPGCVGDVCSFRTGDEVGHFAESVNDDQDGVQLTPSPG